MKKFLAAVLAAVLLPAPVLAEWVARQPVDHWGDPGPILAGSSKDVPPNESPGPRFKDVTARLFVGSRCDAVFAVDMPALSGGHGSVIQVRIDGKRENWPSWAQDEEMIIWSGPKFVKAWAGAKRFEILAPTRSRYVIFSFDMTGSKAAIAKTCPGLKL